jgi:hypothetical protein
VEAHWWNMLITIFRIALEAILCYTFLTLFKDFSLSLYPLTPIESYLLP